MLGIGKSCIEMASKEITSITRHEKYFTIRCSANNKVLSVFGRYAIARARVVPRPAERISRAQLGYEDGISGTIRSKLRNDLVIDCSDCKYLDQNINTSLEVITFYKFITEVIYR